MGVVGDVAGIRFSLMCLYASLGVVRCPGCVDAYTVAFAWHVSQFGVCASMTTFTPAVQSQINFLAFFCDQFWQFVVLRGMLGWNWICSPLLMVRASLWPSIGKSLC